MKIDCVNITDEDWIEVSIRSRRTGCDVTFKLERCDFDYFAGVVKAMADSSCPGAPFAMHAQSEDGEFAE